MTPTLKILNTKKKQFQGTNTKIVNGYPQTSQPWYIALTTIYKDEIRVNCGGTIINKRYVL